MPALQLSNACADCHVVEASIDARKRWLCRYDTTTQAREGHAHKSSECFIKYISSKPIKRIESYRLRGKTAEQPRKLLLPVSGGISSMVLVQIFDRQIQRQISKRGQSTYELHILTVQMSTLPSDGIVAAKFSDLKQAYPLHSFSLVPISEVFRLDSKISEDFSELGGRNGETPQASLANLLSCAKTASCRADMLQLLLTRLIVAVAKQRACEAILWGHSDSRLAAKALSSVAKGRGGYLPFDISDGPSPWGVTFYHPLCDLFKSELVTYANTLPDAFSKLLVPDAPSMEAPTSLRATSIDDLLSNYVETQCEKYPNIIANVVRTAGKLNVPPVSTNRTGFMCPICAMPAFEFRATQETGESNVCYACQRLKLEAKSQCDT